MSASVPFLDLRPSHEPLKAEILDAFAQLIETNHYANGPAVARFERAFAAYVGTGDCVGVASGLDALRLGLVALGLQQSDEVVVPAHTFVATVEAVTQAGGRPVLVDVSEADYCISPEAAATAVTDRTAAILPVHLYGQVADVRALSSLAAQRSLVLLEDACQAHGAERDGIRAGAAGQAAAFSFYPGKNLGAMGDGGALTTSDADVALRVRALREHGQTAKYRHDFEGWTSRLDTIQAIVLERKLAELDAWNEQRRAAATRYLEALDGVGDLRLPPVPAGSSPVWHLFVVRTAEPAALGEHLARVGIGSGRHYPQPVHLTAAYGWLGYREGEFPVAERIAREGLSLPIFPGISEAQLEAVSNAVRSYFDG